MSDPLDYRCEVCKAKPGEKCRNTINPDAPLPGRSSHLARVLPPGRTKPPVACADNQPQGDSDAG